MHKSSALALLIFFAGCKSAPPAAPATEPPAPAPAATYPARPTTAPAPFKIFHHGNSSFTLTVNDKATDDQLSSLVWQLRDAARTHSFDTHSAAPWDKGVILHTADDPHPALLWDPDAPYTPATH
ncbi:MAG TPA: hypothetical protein VG714_03640 [Acidobacteriaceae bacterium]|nr:hypothetical protein [Acidobacteriaceae bacterium]